MIRTGKRLLLAVGLAASYSSPALAKNFKIDGTLSFEDARVNISTSSGSILKKTGSAARLRFAKVALSYRCGNKTRLTRHNKRYEPTNSAGDRDDPDGRNALDYQQVECTRFQERDMSRFNPVGNCLDDQDPQ